MSENKREFSLLSREKRKTLIDEIITFFKEERGEEIGIIAAEDFLDFFLENAGKDIYNKGVHDTRGVLKTRMEDLDMDLDILMKN